MESAYEACLGYELSKLGLDFERQRDVPVRYGDLYLDCGYRIDLLVEKQVVVEVKSVADLAAIHTAQLLTYLKLSGSPVGLLINFNSILLKDGLKRLVN